MLKFCFEHSVVSQKRNKHPVVNKLPVSNKQRAKEVVSDSLGLVDFSIGLVNLVLNLSEGQVVFFLGGGEFKYRRTAISAAHVNFFWATLKTVGLVHTSNNLPDWQAVKPTFFAP